MKFSDLRLSIDLVAAWRVVRRLFGLTAVLVGLSLVGCEEPEEKPIYGINPATMACQRWDVERQAFVGEFLPVSVCSGKPTPELLP